MIWLLLIFIVICFVGIKFNFKSIFKDYLDKPQTNAIRGIFAIIIFFSHFSTYITLGDNLGDNLYLKIISTIGQLMVAPFLFYSGYGIFCSAQKKPNYIKTFPRHRFLKILIFFDIAVIPYLIIALIRGNSYSIWEIILSFTGWTSLGNSNWFMFAILTLYVFTYIAAIFTKHKIKLSTIAIISLLTTIYILVVNHFKHGATYWTDTVLCFSGGALFAHYKDKVSSFLKNKYFFSILSIVFVFTLLYLVKNHLTGLPYIFTYNLLSISFCVMISAVTARIRISNRILHFLGTYSFEIYILQRIPDSLLQPLLGQHVIIFFVVSLSATIIISLFFKHITNYLVRKLLYSSP